MIGPLARAALWATVQAARTGNPTPLDPQDPHDHGGGER
jgi:hypothetical protein